MVIQDAIAFTKDWSGIVYYLGCLEDNTEAWTSLLSISMEFIELKALLCFEVTRKYEFDVEIEIIRYNHYGVTSFSNRAFVVLNILGIPLS